MNNNHEIKLQRGEWTITIHFINEKQLFMINLYLGLRIYYSWWADNLSAATKFSEELLDSLDKAKSMSDIEYILDGHIEGLQ